jgi:hypothetical protein
MQKEKEREWSYEEVAKGDEKSEEEGDEAHEVRRRIFVQSGPAQRDFCD